MAQPATQHRAPDPASRAFLSQKITLGSRQALHVYNRAFNITSKNIYHLAVSLRILASDETTASEIEEIVDNLLTDTMADLKSSRERLKVLRDQNGISTVAEYTSPETIEAEITSPNAGRYLALIKELDEMMSEMDSVWLTGVIGNKQYATEAYAWQRRLIKVGTKIRSIAERAMAAVQKRDKPAKGTSAEAGHDDDEAGLREAGTEAPTKPSEEKPTAADAAKDDEAGAAPKKVAAAG